MFDARAVIGLVCLEKPKAHFEIRLWKLDWVSMSTPAAREFVIAEHHEGRELGGDGLKMWLSKAIVIVACKLVSPYRRQLGRDEEGHVRIDLVAHEQKKLRGMFPRSKVCFDGAEGGI
jgi:hypothetical protein